MKKAVLYIHGKGGSAAESEYYKPLFPDCDVVGLDYKTFTPWETGREIHSAIEGLKESYESLILIANSIGAYFAMNADIDDMVQTAYFISPIVDMERLILNMMNWANIGETQLKQKGVVSTTFGEDLSWEYLSYVREHPVGWTVPTHILYGGIDNLTSYETIKAFAAGHNASLTVMENGEHWFHTEEQTEFLDNWIKRLTQEDEMNTKNYIIRLEKKEDYSEVENMIRESFWNVYRPGCSEHYVIHVLRDDPAFVKELDFVMEQDGRIIGQNMFMKTIINADDGRVIPVLTMGPICITPEHKRMGYGKALLDYSLEKACELGFGAVLFEGNINFYGKSGFDYSSRFGIRYHDLPEGADASFFLCKELIPGYLDGVTGVYQTPKGYYVDDDAVEEFDRDFTPKEKLKLPGQIF